MPTVSTLAQHSARALSWANSKEKEMQCGLSVNSLGLSSELVLLSSGSIWDLLELGYIAEVSH